jgi:hypothetical protein
MYETYFKSVVKTSSVKITDKKFRGLEYLKKIIELL